MASSQKKSVARTSGAVEPDLETVVVDDADQEVAAFVEPAEFQESARTAIEESITESRAVLARAKASADEAASAFELSFAAAKDGMTAMNATALEALRANTEANLDFIKASFAVKNLPDLVALQGEFARSRVKAMSVQVKDLGALAQKTMIETIGPVRDRVAKSFQFAV